MKAVAKLQNLSKLTNKIWLSMNEKYLITTRLVWTKYETECKQTLY